MKTNNLRQIALFLCIAMFFPLIPKTLAIELPMPPGPITGQVSALSPEGIMLSWNPVPGAQGYEVLRSESQNGEYKPLGKTESEAMQYADSAILYNTTYYYKIRAYKTYSHDGYYPPDYGMVPLASLTDTEHPEQIIYIYGPESDVVQNCFLLEVNTITSIKTAKHCAVNITWKPVANAHFYEIMRSSTKNGTYAKVGSTDQTSFVDEKLTSSV